MTGGASRVRAKLKEIRSDPNATAKEQDLATTLEMVYEFYMRGFDFAPIDLYASDPFLFTPEGDKRLRLPFVAISGLGDTAAQDLARARQGGRKFVSIEELSSLCPKVSSAHIDVLKRMGAFGDLPEQSQMTLFDF